MTATTAPVGRRGALQPPRARRALQALMRRGLRDHRRAPLAWGGSLGVFSALIAFMYPSIEDSLRQAVEGYPQGLKEAFGIGQLDTVEAYVHAEMFSLIVPLAVAFFAIRCVTKATVTAEEHGFLDLVLAAPLPRRLLVAGSFAVTAVSVALVLLVVAGLTWTGGLLGGAELSLGATIAGVASVWPLSLFAAAVALVASGLLHRDGAVTGIAMGVLVGMYVIDVLGKLSDPVEPLRFVSAFKYYGAAMQDGLDPGGSAVLTGAALLLTEIGAQLFARRDILH